LAVFAAAGEGIIVQEETLHAVGVLANARMAGFTPYMQALAPHLYSALKNVSAHVVCNAAIGVVGDCCRAVGNAFEPCMKPVMSLLIDALNTEGVDQQVKLSALACFGDIAIACGRPFFELAPVVIDYLKLASGTVVNLSSPEEVIFI
jgi:importin subunit beta-1